VNCWKRKEGREEIKGEIRNLKYELLKNDVIYHICCLVVFIANTWNMQKVKVKLSLCTTP
jgi:hypothetical protein